MYNISVFEREVFNTTGENIRATNILDVIFPEELSVNLTSGSMLLVEVYFAMSYPLLTFTDFYFPNKSGSSIGRAMDSYAKNKEFDSRDKQSYLAFSNH